TVGAIRELITQLGHGLTKQLDCDVVARPQIFLTGGAGATVAELLAPDARYVPHLTLAGIALSIANG
ncbi:MAG TPA: hypothetical protein VIH42_02695, partial [Thermoguttaceae bacterium]